MRGKAAPIFLLRAFQIEVMFADDALGIAHLNSRFTDGTEFRLEHGNERVPQHVMRDAGHGL